MQISNRIAAPVLALCLSALLCVQCGRGQESPVAVDQQNSGFAVRGMHIDLRTQVMTMQALHELADKMQEGGMNTLVMEWEAAFPFEKNATLCNSHAYTRDEVKEFVSYCEARGIDVIPLQNCFGHCDYILRHPRYAGIREDRRDFSQVCPLRGDKCEEIFRSIFSDVLALHNSKYIHIGCDETRLLGKCKRCAKYLESHSVSELFVQYVSRMCALAESFGKTPVIWADILLKYPEAIDQLPKNLVVMDWNYGWSWDKFGDVSNVLNAGLTMWGAPALRSNPDNIYQVDWAKHLGNLEDYVDSCRTLGFEGIILTSWSTSGVYGQIVDSGKWEINEMQPVREVYPLSAFDMLQRAFCESVAAPGFDGKTYVRRYAKEHFGFDEAGQDALEAYYYLPTSAPLEDALAVREAFCKCRPAKEKADYRQLALALDIHINYLKFRDLESRYESASFSLSEASDLYSEASSILREAKALRRRFAKLNGSYLKDTATPLGKNSYVSRLEFVCNNLKTIIYL